MTDRHPMDDQQIIDNLFFVRKTPPGDNDNPSIKDGTIHIGDEDGESIDLGYRFYIYHTDAPVLLYFHGNGEIASDYDTIAPYYHLCGVSLLVVDYRGYGWSSGLPRTTRLLPDAEIIFDALPDTLREHNINDDVSVFIKGRSLGSAPAIYLAYKYGEQIGGLIVESGYADAPSLFRRLDIPLPEPLAADPTLPVNNLGKIREVTTPLLVIHGKADRLIPVVHGEDLYAAAASENKELVLIDHAGHNNIMSTNTAKYFDAVKRFVKAHAGA